MKGFVLYDGPSQIDGKPILGIVTLYSANRKTGNMAQLWILRKDMNPVDTYHSKADESVCGGCPLRHAIGGSCYVQIWQAPRNIWMSWQKGNYEEHYVPEAVNGRKVRLGAYGDPAAIPYEYLARLVNDGNGHTGYTHQAFRKFFDERIAEICMVSVETKAQALKAKKKGWTTFRVKKEDEDLLEHESTCNNETEGIDCASCMRCDGKNGSIVTTVHGVRKKHFDFV